MNTVDFYRNKVKRRKRQAERNCCGLNEYGGLFYGWTYNEFPKAAPDAVTRGAYVQVSSQ